jgi:hypothetical protein
LTVDLTADALPEDGNLGDTVAVKDAVHLLVLTGVGFAGVVAL